MQAEPEPLCEGQIWGRGPRLQLCGASYRVAWSPAFGKHLCDECRTAATSMTLHGLSHQDWIRSHPSADTLRLG